MSGIKIKEIDGGVIKYKAPSVPMLLRMIPTEIHEQAASGTIDHMDMIATLIERLEKVIVEVDHPDAKSYDDLINNPKFISPLVEIAADMVSLFQGVGDSEVKKS